MNNHKDAIKTIQTALKKLAAKKREMRAAILTLKFDAEGFRRPETGPDRDMLRSQYQWPCRAEARAYHIALGLLKGRSYAQIEPKAISVPSLHFIKKALKEALGSEDATKPFLTADGIGEIIRRPVSAEAA